MVAYADSPARERRRDLLTTRVLTRRQTIVRRAYLEDMPAIRAMRDEFFTSMGHTNRSEPELTKLWYVTGPSGNITSCISLREGEHHRHVADFCVRSTPSGRVDGIRLVRWVVLSTSVAGLVLTFAVHRANHKFLRVVDATGWFVPVMTEYDGQFILFRRRIANE